MKLSDSNIFHIFQYLILSLLILPAAALSGCVESEEFSNDPYGNFDALAEIVDTRYCFFEEKDIDWQKITGEYRAKIRPDMSLLEQFNLMADMLDELRDGHVNLSSKFNTSYYRAWWSEYPQDFDLRTLEQYYLKFDWMTTSGMMFKILPGNVGYLRYGNFSSAVSPTALDYVLAYLYKCDAIIIDIRDNGGGLLTNIDTLIGRFITEEIPGGSLTHKTGPEHDAFSRPYPFSYKPADPQQHICYDGPLILLTNRSCFSAANTFAAVMKTLPQVRVIGARTGGGGGMPMSYELPNGWLVRLTASPIYAPDGSCIEAGIDPSPGFECHSPAEELAQGRDGILECALEYADTLPRRVVED